MTGKETTEWFVYMIRCRDGQLYTGIATDVKRRLQEHTSGKGAKFLRGKGPLEVVFTQGMGSRSAALKAEVALKRLSKSDKEQVVHVGTWAIPA